MVIEDFAKGAWAVHSGDLFPFRATLPLYKPPFLVVEWLLTITAAVALFRDRVRVGSMLGLAVTGVALTQRFSNHRCLLLILLLFLVFDPGAGLGPVAGRASATHNGETSSPSFTLARVQLVLVYLFSAANKLAAGFLSGESLINLFGSLPFLTKPLAQGLSVIVILCELTIPALLIWRPRIGLAVLVTMHLAFAIAMPGVVSFGILMTALGVLFLPLEVEHALS